MSMLLACYKMEDNADALPRIGSLGSRRNSEGGNQRGWWQWVKVLWGFLMMACFTLVFVVEFVLRGL